MVKFGVIKKADCRSMLFTDDVDEAFVFIKENVLKFRETETTHKSQMGKHSHK